jgi:hypothetical protein
MTDGLWLLSSEKTGAHRKSFEQLVEPLPSRIAPEFFANRTLAAPRYAPYPKLGSPGLPGKDVPQFLRSAF